MIRAAADRAPRARNLLLAVQKQFVDGDRDTLLDRDLGTFLHAHGCCVGQRGRIAQFQRTAADPDKLASAKSGGFSDHDGAPVEDHVAGSG